MRLQEEKEEERYRKFDATLRDYQRSRMHTAATYDGRGRKKSKFFKSIGSIYKRRALSILI